MTNDPERKNLLQFQLGIFVPLRDVIQKLFTQNHSQTPPKKNQQNINFLLLLPRSTVAREHHLKNKEKNNG
jgi:hypothetical protein